MKVLFLDFDGVLHSFDHMNAMHIMKHRHKRPAYETMDEYGHVFDPRCVAYLDHIIESTGAKIVISSTWRTSGLKSMKEMWHARELPGDVIDITPTSAAADIVERYPDPFADRGYEIQEWVDKHPEVGSYVILDDESGMLPHQPFVQCDGEFGITGEVACMAIDLLQIESGVQHGGSQKNNCV